MQIKSSQQQKSVLLINSCGHQISSCRRKALKECDRHFAFEHTPADLSRAHTYPSEQACPTSVTAYPLAGPGHNYLCKAKTNQTKPEKSKV